MCFFFFNDTATTEIYTLSLHDALPISVRPLDVPLGRHQPDERLDVAFETCPEHPLDDPPVHSTTVEREEAPRSEEHTSELQSRQYLVCRLLLEKKNLCTLISIYNVTLM